MDPLNWDQIPILCLSHSTDEGMLLFTFGNIIKFQADGGRHKYYLDSLCRICNQRIKLRNGYRNAKLAVEYADQIKGIFKGADVSVEDHSRYPPKLCANCVGGLSRWQPNQSLRTFEPHSKNQCSVCKHFQKYVPNPLRSAKPASTHAILEQELTRLAFHKVPSLIRDLNDVLFMRFKGHIAEFVIDIDSKIQWVLSVYGRGVSSESLYSLFGLTNTLNNGVISSILQSQNCIRISLGNKGFDALLAGRFDLKSSLFRDSDGHVLAYVENDSMMKIDVDYNTIQYVNFTRFIKDGTSRC